MIISSKERLERGGGAGLIFHLGQKRNLQISIFVAFFQLFSNFLCHLELYNVSEFRKIHGSKICFCLKLQTVFMLTNQMHSRMAWRSDWC